MQQKQNMILAFLQEMFQRFATRSPRFFKIWQVVTAVATLVTGVPEFLAFIGVTLPESLTVLQDRVVGAFSTGLFIMSMMTTQSKPVGVTADGSVIKVTNDKLLPFTARSEDKKASKDPSIPEATIITTP